TTGKVYAGLGQQNCQLEWKDMLTIKVLMQTIVITRFILQKKRGRSLLTRIMATFDEFGMILRIACIDPHRFIPSICNWNQIRINRCPESAQEIGQGVAEILVFPTTEAMPSHDNSATEAVVISIEISNGPAFLRRKKPFQYGVTLIVQVHTHPLP